MISTSTPPNVLLVEDSEDDLFFFRRLLKKAGIDLPLAVAMDGQEAIDHLQHALLRPTPDAPPLPDLVLLDLKLPLKGGFEVLEWMRAQPGLARVPVVILSSSSEARDVAQAFSGGAQGYLVKHPRPATLIELLRRVAELPVTAPVSVLAVPESLRP